MPHILLLYATREGQTEKIARKLASHLSAAGAEVHLEPASPSETIDVTAYDLVICGASLHAGHIEKEMLATLTRHAALSNVARSFFLVSLSAAVEDPAERARELADARTKLDAQLPFAFDDVEMIAGALRYSVYSRPVRWLMQRIARNVGTDTDTNRDYEFTDWAAVADYAARLLARAKRQPPD